MTSSSIFISYSRQDSQFSLRLAADLRAVGLNVWVDQLDIAAGSRWDNEIQTALNTAQEVLVLLSPFAVASQNVLDEAYFALDEGKKLVPIVITPCQIPFRLRRLQRVEFKTDYSSALAELLRLLEVRSGSSISLPDETTIFGITSDNLVDPIPEPPNESSQPQKQEATVPQHVTPSEQPRTGSITGSALERVLWIVNRATWWMPVAVLFLLVCVWAISTALESENPLCAAKFASCNAFCVFAQGDMNTIICESSCVEERNVCTGLATSIPPR